ncbi:glycosyltransferase family 90 protein [Tulasnella calospora MUT 4182]|uniref:Glycosyltransferase family 90 protein n=1 Tax=Tulasnella calospora MUT 4182 TaxID=1051891 RepID=A0A0C3QFJ8_9AGAM|nr:glycosyltransferase family 90 protein [Tulasnella calospora MUT 4182]
MTASMQPISGHLQRKHVVPTTSSAAEVKLHHTYRPDGLVEFVPSGLHPVYELIQVSEKKWRDKLERSSRTLKEAVEEYRRRYHRMPPKDFDKWWRYVVQHKVQLPDEYDQIYHDLEPFWGMSPAFIQEQQHIWEKDGEVGSFTLANEDHRVFLAGHSVTGDEEGTRIARERAADQLRLLEEVQQWLPDFRATFTAHDVPYQFIGYDLRSEAVYHAAISEYMDKDSVAEFQNHQRGWSYACPQTSPLRKHNFSATFESSELWEAPKTFIHDHKASMDPCQHVAHVHLNGFLSSREEGPVLRKNMVPAFSICSTRLHSDILTVAMDMWTESVAEDPEWKDKKHDKLLWRGRNTGMLFKEDGKWEDSQRARLVGIANSFYGHVYVLDSASSSTESVISPHSAPLDLLNEKMMDIGFSGEAIQCEPAACEELENTFTYKDATTFVDGNGWSARFKRLITSNSLVFKSTIFPEWYTDRIQPWVHYIPIKNDFTDLYDVFTFFHGDVDGNNSHDDIAERIARQGKEWSLTFWRKEDMVAYTFRLFLEYARVMSRDREAATFRWEDVKG